MNVDDDSEIDLGGQIDVFGNFLANTINSVRNATGSVQNAVNGNTSTTVNQNQNAGIGINPVVVVLGALAIGGLIYSMRK